MKLIKTSLTVITGVLLTCFANAQNTFPPTGNVAIGTASPDAKLTVVGDIHTTGMLGTGGAYFSVLHIGPLGNSPSYYYIDTNIPANDVAAPQLTITGYIYGDANKAMKMTLGWYYYGGNFYWSQYQSDIGYWKPSRVRLGKYSKNGSDYVRIEIANGGVYWSNYTVSATDRTDFYQFYQGWTYAEGEMPVTTSQVTEVSRAGIVIDNDLPVTGTITAQAGSIRPVTLGPSGMIYSKGDAGGWAFGYHAKGNAGIDKGGFGFCGGNNDLYYYYIGPSYANPALTVISGSNNIGIGTTTPGSYKLAVNGDVKVKKLVVTQQNWPDYVFSPGYQLRPISQVERYIRDNKHLPEMPSVKEVKANGVDIADTQALLLKKVEELTLYMINVTKENEQLKARVQQLETKIKK